MSFQVRVEGGAELHAVRRTLAAIGAKGLGKQMAAGFREASRPFKPAIQAEIPRTMPSGYAPVLSRSLRVRQAIRSSGSTAEALLKVSAQGARGRRALPDLNRGVLRHPLYGRRRHWYAQRVTPGVVDRPAERLIPAAVAQMHRVIDEVARQIGGT